MTVITFDTLKLVDTLETAKIPQEQARAIVRVVQDAQDGAEIITRGDLREAEHRLDTRLLQTDTKIDMVRKDVEFLRWMMGLVLGGIVALFIRSFF